MKQNVQKELDRLLDRLSKEGRRPRLLLHGCCAPCSSYVLEYLSRTFAITLYYYNPNISPKDEYERRVQEVQRLLREEPEAKSVRFKEGPYDPERFFERAKGHEQEPEGGARCFACYQLRLEQAAAAALAGGYDYFTTTLSISPYKNAEKLNELGGQIAQTVGIPYLYSDFKKRDGYRRSIELSKQYGLYRQDYCGCVFSAAERERQRAALQTEPENDEKIQMKKE